MSDLIVHGGKPLRGRLVPSANKNAVLPILCATLLTREPVRLRGIPTTAASATAADTLPMIDRSQFAKK